MHRKGFIRFQTLAFMLLGALIVNAQENKCDVKVNVFEPDEILMLIEAKVSIRNLTSGSAINADTRFEPFVFRNLPESDYEISVVKENYKQSLQKVTLNCKYADEKRIRTFGVILQKGSATEKVSIDERGDKMYSMGFKGVETSREERLKKFAAVNNLLNGKATLLGKPKYPPMAKAVRASGIVYVEVTVGERGEIISAEAVSGHPLLRAAAVNAARESTFAPTLLEGKPVKVTGVIVYNFVP